MKAELEVVKGYPNRKVPVAAGRPITIGRSKAADVQILHSVVSRLHCQLQYDGSVWVLKDLDSRNGTWIGQNRIKVVNLADGDSFEIGRKIELRLTFSSTAAEATSDSYSGESKFLASLLGAEFGGVRVIEHVSGEGPEYQLRAHQPSLNRHVLLHAFDPEKVGAKDFKEKLLEEVRGASKLLQPNILQIHDMIEHRGALVVVMELFPSDTLRRILEKRRFVNVNNALNIANLAAGAYAYAQDQDQVVNRICPDDILVDEENAVKVRFFHPPLFTKVEIESLPYVAPEVISAGGLRTGTSRAPASQKDAALRSSVYSLGSILYHMLAGIPPHDGKTEDQLLPKILKETPPSLRRVNLKVSPALARVVERAMDKNPAGRPADFKTFQLDLKKIISPAF